MSCELNDINYSLISAVRDGRLERAREIINSFGLSYSKAWSEGYVLLCDAVKNKHSTVAKLLLTSGSKVNSKNTKPVNTPLHFAAINGDIEIIEIILDKNAYVNAKNKYGRTPLHNAIENKKVEVTELLLKHGADVNVRDNEGEHPLHVAVMLECSQIVELLFKYGAYVNCVHTSTLIKGYAPLHFAAEKGSKELITLLLSRGANADVQGEDGYTPLHLASKQDRVEAVKLFLNRGANVNASAKGNLTPLHIATKRGHNTVVKLLLQHGAKVDNQDKDGKTILHLAVENHSLMIVEDVLKYYPDINNQSNRNSLKTALQGYGEMDNKIVEVLLEYGIIVNPEDAWNPEVLHAAVEKGYLKIVEDILKYGSDVNMLHNSPSRKGFTPLHSAAKSKREEVVKLLISYGADINAQDETEKTPIFYAIENADIAIIKLLLTNGANVNNPELLNIAVKKECREIIEALLQHDADTNASDIYGRTALHFTAVSESGGPFEYVTEASDINIIIKGEIAKLLLSKGANVDAQTKDGVTTLHAATQNGFAKVVEALLEYNANINYVVEGDITPLHISVQNGHKDISAMLLSKGANVNAKQKKGLTALHIASQKGHKEVVKVLLEYGAKVDSKCTSDITPLHLSVQNGNRDISIMLLNKGANANAKQKFGLTALHFACQKGYEEIVEVLLRYRAKVNSKSTSDITPLHLSAQNGKDDISAMLLEKGANVNAKQKDGLTALHIATKENCREIIETILKFGADINSIDGYGRTALHIASESGYGEAVAILLQYGSDINITSINNCTPFDSALAELRSSHSAMEYYSRDRSRYISHYDRRRCVCKCEVAAGALLHHIIKMKTANLYVSEKNLLSMRNSDDVSDFQEKCEEEIASMKSENVNNANISFYDILAKGTNALAIYMKNENIVQVLKSGDYKPKFPIYASIVGSHFRKGMERKELLEQGNIMFHILFNNFPELPHDCTEKIFSYLSNEDLRIIIEVCKPPSISSPNQMM